MPLAERLIVAPPHIVPFVEKIASEYGIKPALVLALAEAEWQSMSLRCGAGSSAPRDALLSGGTKHRHTVQGTWPTPLVKGRVRPARTARAGGARLWRSSVSVGVALLRLPILPR